MSTVEAVIVGTTGGDELIDKSLPKLGDDGGIGADGDVQLGNPSVANCVNSLALAWNTTAFLKSQSSSICE